MSRTKNTNVILHAFDWPYRLVAEHAEKIAQSGYKSVLISPPVKSMKTSIGTPWWQRYQPTDYRVIENQLGDTLDLKHMIDALLREGVYTYADVVLNHMANESDMRSDLTYPSCDEQRAYQDEKDYYQSIKLFGDLNEPLFTETDFVKAFGIKNWKDKWQVQHGRITGGQQDPGLPTLRECDHVTEQQRLYLKALKQLGVKGFRIDAAKHISLKQLLDVWQQDITQDTHIFGEIITDGGATKEEYQLFLQPYLEKTRLGAYDFPLFQTIYQALQPEGSLKSLVNPYCFGQALSKNRAVTFAITHDIPNNDVFRDLVMPEELEWLAYSYILGRDGGVPLIYTDLNPSGILNGQQKPRWQDMWMDPRMTARVHFHNAVHGQPMAMQRVTDTLMVFSRGNMGYVAINKSCSDHEILLHSHSPLLELLTGETYSPTEGQIYASIPPMSSALYLVCSEN
ncbi:alpha-amylase family protein [Vibrio sp. S4M6]|uniref:alpha-amylase family protein n=1 Tax=Vibrio sinus TaxID=2946865 RepID=UPI00202A5B82|nr:alpha-amylase family protein [Vibrio sinus]MCL9780615.1 alpha-amylase family protein [Vibrio sinus]